MRFLRNTGVGIFAESQKLSLKTESRDQPVFGNDSVQQGYSRRQIVLGLGRHESVPRSICVVSHDRGDDAGKSFVGTAATDSITRRLFFGDDARPRNLAKMPGKGATWLDG
ncbi:MAG: hypothetical protein VYA84_10480 [Planctomycetota bacterium]|nr:hypothetical protein [Planctomycetota bacterium]